MKRLLVFILAVTVSATSCVFAAKYKVNSSGVVKSNGGKVISAPANTVNQNYYNNYSATNYVSNNQVNSTQVNTIEIVMDYSGSMANWIGVAKRSMTSIVAQIPPSVNLGFRVFGHDMNGGNPSNSTIQQVKKIVRKSNGKYDVKTGADAVVGQTYGACSATQQVTKIAPANAQSMLFGMDSVNIGGVTPLVYALDRAVNQDFAGMDMVSPKKIVLITDGYENCNGDPCAFARKLMQTRSDIHIDVVLVSSNSRALTCLASTTGGHFYTIDNLSDFSSVVNQSIQSVPSDTVQQNQPPVPTQNYEYIKDEDDLY